jgi:eukaryotic-like serine/threonine-protein kinase
VSGREPVGWQQGDLLDGRYMLGPEIGEGAHGQVFAAGDMQENRLCAVKVLHPFIDGDDQFVNRLYREARSLAALWGQSVVEVYGFGQDPSGSVYLVMELLQGRTLAQQLDDLEEFGDRMNPHAVLVAVEPIARALHTAHQMGIIHRDVKPSNIFLLDDEAGGGARLMDFGLAKVDDQMSLTQTGVVAGSPHYMAPEMLRAESFDHRIDVYSLAAVMYRALAGQPMFPGDKTHEILMRVLRERRPRLTALRPELHPAVDDWVQEALSLDPSYRYLDVPSMWNGLLEAVQLGDSPGAIRARYLSPLAP